MSSEIESTAAQSSARVYQTLMDLILDSLKKGELQPGDKLPSERKWAESMDVSRSAVREAIRALEMIGLVNTRHGGGTYINDSYNLTMFQPMTISYRLNHGTIIDIHVFRQGLEIEAAALAAQRANDEDIKELNEIVKKLLLAENTEEGSKYDRKFHNKIAEMSGNCLIRDSLSSVGALLDEIVADLRSMIFKSDSNARILVDQHKKIADSIADHKPELARKYMTEHMQFNSRFINLLE